MLTEICRELNNWFDVRRILGDFSIVGGALEIDGIQTGQYFRIVGSVFNDGVYQYPASDLQDESFSGGVWLMAVPKEVLQLSDDVDKWTAKYTDVVNSPYTSESFGGYSYSKASGNDGAAGVTWQSVFRKRLNRWRKL